MSEAQPQEAIQQPTAKDIDDGNKSETTSMLDRADRAAERMEKATKEYQKLVERNEAIAARMLISGRAEAGVVAKTPQEKADAEMDKRVKEMIDRFEGKRR